MLTLGSHSTASFLGLCYLWVNDRVDRSKLRPPTTWKPFARTGTWTLDPQIKSLMLYRLSYPGSWAKQVCYVLYKSRFHTNRRAEAHKKLRQIEQRPWKEQLSAQKTKVKGANATRSRQGSNLRGETPMDFESIALTSRPRLRLAVALQLPWLQEGRTGRHRASDTKSSWRMRWQKGARRQKSAVTRIRTRVAATTQSTNHYTIMACHCPTFAKRASGVFVRCREGAEEHARDMKKRHRRFSSACRRIT